MKEKLSIDAPNRWIQSAETLTCAPENRPSEPYRGIENAPSSSSLNVIRAPPSTNRKSTPITPAQASSAQRASC